MREDERTVEKSRGERISLVDIWGKSIPGRGISRCKGPEVEEGLMDFSKGGRSIFAPQVLAHLAALNPNLI